MKKPTQQQLYKTAKDMVVQERQFADFIESRFDQVKDYSWITLVETPTGEEIWVQVAVSAKRADYDPDEAIAEFEFQKKRKKSAK